VKEPEVQARWRYKINHCLSSSRIDAQDTTSLLSGGEKIVISNMLRRMDHGAHSASSEATDTVTEQPKRSTSATPGSVSFPVSSPGENNTQRGGGDI
jgi:hypothetical protein